MYISALVGRRVKLGASLVLALSVCWACTSDRGSEGGETQTGDGSGTLGNTETTTDDPSTGDGDGDGNGDGDGDGGDGDGDTGCPENLCDPTYGAFCGEQGERHLCEQDVSGCWVPTGETEACGAECVLGVCCDDWIRGEVECECISNPCLDNDLGVGHFCLPDGQMVQCSDTFGCLVPTNGTPEECSVDSPCDQATGTCGGCNPDDQCFGWSEGTKVCVGGASATCGIVDGCMVETDVVSCANGCFFNIGCCGVAGEPCCQNNCFNGTQCVEGICQ
jgi:hypothetical protein